MRLVRLYRLFWRSGREYAKLAGMGIGMAIAIFLTGAALGGLLRDMRDRDLIRAYREQSKQLLESLEQMVVSTAPEGRLGLWARPIQPSSIASPYLADSAVPLPSALMLPRSHGMRHQAAPVPVTIRSAANG